MSPHFEPPSLAVDIRRFSWIKRLPADYAFDFRRLSSFFAGDPGDASAWKEAMARVGRDEARRSALADVLQAQQERRGAPQEARAAVARLREARAAAVVTGQQAGLFGGPLFTLLKALTAMQLAERVRTEHGVPAVAVFWVDSEDHDWDEVNRCGVLDSDLAVRVVAAGRPIGSGTSPVAAVRLDDSITAALVDLEAHLPATEFTDDLLGRLREIYRPGVGMAEAFSRWLEQLLGPRGLVVFDAADPAAKPLAARVFLREIELAGRTVRLAAEAGEKLVALDYHVQVGPHLETLALFHVAETREPVRIGRDGYLLGDGPVSSAALVSLVRREPAAFSPGVLLRPIVQDALFPTICYVAGPSELAYLAQLRQVYEAFSVPMPLVYQRATATIVDSNAMRFLSRYSLPLEALRAQDEAALNELLVDQLPPPVESSLDEVTRTLEQGMDVVARHVRLVDATLEGAARSTWSRMREDLRKLHGKVLQAAKRKDDTLRRQYRHAQALVFPDGRPQERELGTVWFLNRYGPGLIDRLIETLPLSQGTHWVIVV